MMYNFCTLFDSNYLTRGLALHESLVKTGTDFHLYIFAFDDTCAKVLSRLKPERTTVITLAEFEDNELKKVKPSRSVAEYCWTCTSSTILYCLNTFNLDQCTYLDADLYFYSKPDVIFDELGDKSVLITEHRYSSQYNKALKSGKYCVQFVTFRNDKNGREALEWWRERCLEWCYARYEDGKYGDQLYLEDWTTRFNGVHELQHLGGGLAAWNVQQYEFTKDSEKFTGREIATGKTFDVIFYHFHYLKFFSGGYVELGRRTLTQDVLESFYKPYTAKLMEMSRRLQKEFPGLDGNGIRPAPAGLKDTLVSLYRKIKGVYHIYSLKEFLT